ncbi:glycoside hydrolase family 3 N-terminal domain-containing protein [Anaerocolumna sp. MB42-C2]|uniref:glycoside hydrolase family 3 N-terminal domain-containing protein n=1 Tax=Anaerocolumna sp. MB42-C2 TaxID=3070997 RepID=UPI0027E20F24|nr:glycoside hydrolase family 3 N-terminal domain-containing protein [Anaerocolumna sp. MB42-C2]WMJ88729.1 glycoside hydrolase family 3 N-terminal domain-containing protein [Anaerocolumna sp. MB42-C2]
MTYLYKDNKYTARQRAENLLSLMTVKEKVGQLNQRLYGFSVYERIYDEIKLTDEFKNEVAKFDGLGVLYGLYRADPWSGKDFDTGLTGELAPKTYNMIQRYVMEHSSLGIPMMLSSECPHGHQALDGYLVPVNLSAGATFHPELLKSAYQVCGKQLKELGVNLALISVLDIVRDPRWGRSEECYSEDPYLSSELAKAAVTGIQSNGIVAVAKHFCAQGEGTGGINASAARIGERELREIHLPAAKACVRAGVKGIMAAYNEIDGIPCHGNKKLLTEILRDEMQFQGVIMADGVAIDQLDVMTGDNELSGAIALKAGVDISLWDTGFSKLNEALNRGLITEEDIDMAVLRVLTLKFELGLFDNPYIEEKDSGAEFTYEKYPEALKLARESAVLLKNKNNTLPLNINKIGSIAVIGPNADEIYHQLGDYTPPINNRDGITVLKGIKDYIKKNNSSIEVKFHKGCGLFEGTEESLRKAAEIADSCDCTILVLGGSSSRFGGASFDINGAARIDAVRDMDCGEGLDSADLRLPGLQNKLAEAVYKTGCSVITVLIQGRPYSIPEIAENSDSVLCAFYPGMKGGQALAEIIFGEISPSGHLPVSIPRHGGQIPVYYNYKNSYAGMKYYDIDNKPLYPFGYGLSYTEFAYSNIRMECIPFETEHKGFKMNLYESGKSNENSYRVSSQVLHSGGLRVNFEISNLGGYDGFSVPQLYIKDLQASTIRRVKELKAFDKIWIPQGETRSCTLNLNEEKLSIWNDKMQFVTEPGEFRLSLTDGSKDIWECSLFLE